MSEYSKMYECYFRKPKGMIGLLKELILIATYQLYLYLVKLYFSCNTFDSISFNC